MTFCNKVWISHNGVPASSMLNSFRCISSSNKIQIAGLSDKTNDQSLKKAVSCFGELIDVGTVCVVVSGTRRRYGFMRYIDAEASSAAKSAMDGVVFEGQRLHIRFPIGRLISVPSLRTQS